MESKFHHPVFEKAKMFSYDQFQYPQWLQVRP